VLSRVRFGDELVEVVFGEYLAHHQVLLARRDRLDRLIADQATQGSWAPTVARLRCLRGIDTLTAVGWSPRSVTSPRSNIQSSWPATSDWSRQSGPPASAAAKVRSPRPAPATRGGLLVEAAWHYRRPTRR